MRSVYLVLTQTAHMLTLPAPSRPACPCTNRARPFPLPAPGNAWGKPHFFVGTYPLTRKLLSRLLLQPSNISLSYGAGMGSHSPLCTYSLWRTTMAHSKRIPGMLETPKYIWRIPAHGLWVCRQRLATSLEYSPRFAFVICECSGYVL